MSTASPTAFLLWSILSVLFLTFLIYHLWCYDRFACLRWSAGRQPGAFKRVMTYSYLGAVPLLAIYSVGMTVIKYREGYIVLHDGSLMTRPLDMFRPANRRWVLPLQFVFSFAWALEMVTHLEELAFWLYLLNQTPEKEPWFSSWEYRLWYMGSLGAIIGMPLTALITRTNILTTDAYVFLVGASGSTSTTIATLYVLWRFPQFIRHVKEEGADPSVVVRLATFFQLNKARVIFRFLFTGPLLVLAVDGISATGHIINRNLFVTDFLLMIAGIGSLVSSAITLLIFFPRSIVRENGYKPKPASTLNSPKSAHVSPTFAVSPQGVPLHVLAGASFPSPVPGVGMVLVPQRLSTVSSPIPGVTSSRWEVDESYAPSSPGDGSMDHGAAYESPAYRMAEEHGELHGRRRRRPSRSHQHPHPAVQLDAAGADADDEQEEGDAEDDEERVPPYQHSAEADVQQLHRRHPFPHSVSTPQVPGAPGAAPSPEPVSPVTPPPAAAAAPPSTSPSSSPKRQPLEWEGAPQPLGLGRGAALHARQSYVGPHGVRRSLHVIATGPQGMGSIGGPAGLGLMQRQARRGSGLHPYVMTFTSPIDLLDIPSREELPRP